MKTGSLALNAVCPYFTMFPLSFPYSVLEADASEGEWVLDPFCGRGTTNFASRMLGLPSIGIDSSPVAAALTQAKLANTSPWAISGAAQEVLDEVPEAHNVPRGEFWEWALEAQTLRTLCRLREGLLAQCDTDARKALRAIILGALHGPMMKGVPSYFSNQCPRTYAPKPAYAVRFWRARDLRPMYVDALNLIARRAERYYGQALTRGQGEALLGDSRDPTLFKRLAEDRNIKWIITSPPYYGLKTYIPDQWLRYWFLGGSADVDYSMTSQLLHASPTVFASQLRQVWQNAAAVSVPSARLVIRFGAINYRKLDPLDVIRQSLLDSGWRIVNIQPAGSALRGKRQAEHFVRSKGLPIEEHDILARLA
jgi:DNA methylase